MNRIYPVPVRKPWRVLLEFNDGQHLTGMTDADLVQAWRRMHWLAPLPDPHNDLAQFKALIIEHAGALYGDLSARRLRHADGAMSDGAFLDALNDAGAITVIRK